MKTNQYIGLNQRYIRSQSIFTNFNCSTSNLVESELKNLLQPGIFSYIFTFLYFPIAHT